MFWRLLVISFIYFVNRSDRDKTVDDALPFMFRAATSSPEDWKKQGLEKLKNL